MKKINRRTAIKAWFFSVTGILIGGLLLPKKANALQSKIPDFKDGHGMYWCSGYESPDYPEQPPHLSDITTSGSFISKKEVEDFIKKMDHFTQLHTHLETFNMRPKGFFEWDVTLDGVLYKKGSSTQMHKEIESDTSDFFKVHCKRSDKVKALKGVWKK